MNVFNLLIAAGIIVLCGAGCANNALVDYSIPVNSPPTQTSTVNNQPAEIDQPKAQIESLKKIKVVDVNEPASDTPSVSLTPTDLPVIKSDGIDSAMPTSLDQKIASIATHVLATNNTYEADVSALNDARDYMEHLDSELGVSNPLVTPKPEVQIDSPPID